MLNDKTHIYDSFSQKIGQIAVLVDPEKTNIECDLIELIRKSEFAGVSYFFVGGSTASRKDLELTVHFLKKNTQIPVVIFPGGSHQLSNEADALLYLSLVSGRNPDYLITQHIQSAEEVASMDFELIPTAYILVDGGTKSSVAYVSQTTPIPRSQLKIAVNTALAAVFQGKKLVYFDAGSGANETVPCTFIEEFKKIKKNIPVIVGGGIKHLDTISRFRQANVNVIVIGNKLEEDIDFLLDIKEFVENNKPI